MSKIVGLVGHCGPDSYMLRSAVKYALKDADVRMLNSDSELKVAVEQGARVLLINRVLDGGFEDSGGVDLIRTAKQNWPEVKCMLISNYADAQAAAEAAGAERGFGKSQIGTPQMKQALESAFAAGVDRSEAERA
jgi:DNA-binding NarL/FixJ family response regulator